MSVSGHQGIEKLTAANVLALNYRSECDCPGDQQVALQRASAAVLCDAAELSCKQHLV